MAPRNDNSGGFAESPCTLATLASVDWVDVLIIVLMLLAAVQGLRLGALVQLLTFAGFWLGLLLGTLVWVRALSFIHHANERAGIRSQRSSSPRAPWPSSAARWGATAIRRSAVSTSLRRRRARVGVRWSRSCSLRGSWPA